MTPLQVWTILRWPLAIVLLLAVANYALGNLGEAALGMVEFDASGSILAPEDEEAVEGGDDLLADIPEAAPPPVLEPGTGPVTDGTSTAIADFFVNDTVADIDNDGLVIGDNPADSIVIAFDIPAGDPGCMAVVNMNLTAEDVRSSTEIGVFASTVDQPVDVRDNQQVDGDLRATATPMAVARVEAEGQLTLDLTTGFQEYFTQEFDAGRPFVLTVVATVPVETQGGVRFTSTEGDPEGESAPRLLWTGTPDCPGGATTDLPTDE
jgi:hypothetical protein